MTDLGRRMVIRALTRRPGRSAVYRSDALGIYGKYSTANPYNIYTTVFAYSGNPVTGSPAGGAGQAAAGV